MHFRRPNVLQCCVFPIRVTSSAENLEVILVVVSHGLVSEKDPPQESSGSTETQLF